MKRRKRDANFHRPTDTELLVAYITSRYGRESVKGLTRREKLARWGLEPVGRKHVRRIRRAMERATDRGDSPCFSIPTR